MGEILTFERKVMGKVTIPEREGRVHVLEAERKEKVKGGGCEVSTHHDKEVEQLVLQVVPPV